MSLDVVNNTSHEETNGLHPCGVIKGGAVFENWREFPYTNVSHHGSTCCEMAREWLYAMDYTQLNGGSPFTGPRWLRQRYNWGPTVYPIHWCEAVEEKTLDCGALASLSREVFKSRNVRAYPAQLVQQFTTHATAQWQKKWNEKEASTHWINDDVIYHEGCAILTEGNEIKVWDSSAGWWVRPIPQNGYGSLLALRICADDRNNISVFQWGDHKIAANRWQKFETQQLAAAA
jgi:hypothetical protein